MENVLEKLGMPQKCGKSTVCSLASFDQKILIFGFWQKCKKKPGFCLIAFGTKDALRGTL